MGLWANTLLYSTLLYLGKPAENTSEVRKWQDYHSKIEFKSFPTVYDTPILLNIGLSYTVGMLCSALLYSTLVYSTLLYSTLLTLLTNNSGEKPTMFSIFIDEKLKMCNLHSIRSVVPRKK